MPADGSLLNRIKMFEEQTPEKFSRASPSSASSPGWKKTFSSSVVSHDSALKRTTSDNDAKRIKFLQKCHRKASPTASSTITDPSTKTISKSRSINGCKDHQIPNRKALISHGSSRVVAYFDQKVENEEDGAIDEGSPENSSTEGITAKVSGAGKVVSGKNVTNTQSSNHMFGVVLRKSGRLPEETTPSSPPNEMQNSLNNKTVKDLEPNKKFPEKQLVRTSTERPKEKKIVPYSLPLKPPTPNWRGEQRLQQIVGEKESRNAKSDSSRDENESRDCFNEEQVEVSEPLTVSTGETEDPKRANPWANVSLRKTPPNSENTVSNGSLVIQRGKLTLEGVELTKTSVARKTQSSNRVHHLGKPPTPTSTPKGIQSSPISVSRHFGFPSNEASVAKDEQSPGCIKKQTNNIGKNIISTIDHFDSGVSLDDRSVAASSTQGSIVWNKGSLQKENPHSLLASTNILSLFTSTEIRDDCLHAIEVEQVEQLISRECPTDEVTIPSADDPVAKVEQNSQLKKHESFTTQDITKEMTVENVLLQGAPSIDALSSVSRDSDDTQGTLQLISFVSITPSGNPLEINPPASEAALTRSVKSELTQDAVEQEAYETSDVLKGPMNETHDGGDALPSDDNEGIEVIRHLEVNSEVDNSHPEPSDDEHPEVVEENQTEKDENTPNSAKDDAHISEKADDVVSKVSDCLAINPPACEAALVRSEKSKLPQYLGEQEAYENIEVPKESIREAHTEGDVLSSENDEDIEVTESIEVYSEVDNSQPKQIDTVPTDEQSKERSEVEQENHIEKDEDAPYSATDDAHTSINPDDDVSKASDCDDTNKLKAGEESKDTSVTILDDASQSPKALTSESPSIKEGECSQGDETMKGSSTNKTLKNDVDLPQRSQSTLTSATIVDDASQSSKAVTSKFQSIKERECSLEDETMKGFSTNKILNADEDLPPRSPGGRGRRMNVIRSIKNRSHIRACRFSETGYSTTANTEKSTSSVLQKKWNIDPKKKLREKSSLYSGGTSEENCKPTRKVTTVDEKTAKNSAHKRALVAKRQKLRQALKQQQHTDQYGDDASVASVDTQNSRVSSVLGKYRASPTIDTQSSPKVSRGVRMARALNITSRTTRGRSPSSSSSIKKAGRSPSPCPSLGCVSTQSSIGPPVIISESQAGDIQRPVPRRLNSCERPRVRRTQLL